MLRQLIRESERRRVVDQRSFVVVGNKLEVYEPIIDAVFFEWKTEIAQRSKFFDYLYDQRSISARTCYLYPCSIVFDAKRVHVSALN